MKISWQRQNHDLLQALSQKGASTITTLLKSFKKTPQTSIYTHTRKRHKKHMLWMRCFINTRRTYSTHTYDITCLIMHCKSPRISFTTFCRNKTDEWHPHTATVTNNIQKCLSSHLLLKLWQRWIKMGICLKCLTCPYIYIYIHTCLYIYIHARIYIYTKKYKYKILPYMKTTPSFHPKIIIASEYDYAHWVKVILPP